VVVGEHESPFRRRAKRVKLVSVHIGTFKRVGRTRPTGSREGLRQPVGGSRLEPREHVAVGVQGDPDGRVAEALADDLRMLAHREHQGAMLLIVRDVEAELQLGRTRTYELPRSGSLPVIRVGRAVREPRDALRR
jgi:hypothetical protein